MAAVPQAASLKNLPVPSEALKETTLAPANAAAFPLASSDSTVITAEQAPAFTVRGAVANPSCAGVPDPKLSLWVALARGGAAPGALAVRTAVPDFESM